MAIRDEKDIAVEHEATDTERNASEPEKAAYIPRSDEEYNVTFKTWLVVGVSHTLSEDQKTVAIARSGD